jgi:hypothetical protein
MGFSLAAIKTDRKKEDEGVWVSSSGVEVREKELDKYIADNPEDGLFLISSVKGRRFEWAIQMDVWNDREKLQEQRDSEDYDPEQIESDSIDNICNRILHDWRNITDDDGKEIPFDRDFARAEMHENRALYKLISKLSANGDYFLADQQRKDAEEN